MYGRTGRWERMDELYRVTTDAVGKLLTVFAYRGYPETLHPFDVPIKSRRRVIVSEEGQTDASVRCGPARGNEQFRTAY